MKYRSQHPSNILKQLPIYVIIMSEMKKMRCDINKLINDLTLMEDILCPPHKWSVEHQILKYAREELRDYKEETNTLSKSLMNSMTAHQHALETMDAMKEEIRILKDINKDLEIDLLNNDS